MLVTNSPLVFENQNALPAWPARAMAARSLTDTPKIFARPLVAMASSSVNVVVRMWAGDRPSERAAPAAEGTGA